MYREFFIRSPLLALPLVALVIFLVVFAGVVVAVLRRRPRDFEATASLPLDDGEEGRHG